eukprot:TRINITY_DN120214_c0_g1_i1.p1 TRINITY_DN120214_c0_g1~~TRINITY_DN120214_c0_g1_i1.p1  ORF type:complete len:523 (-),score=64.37 TRINITY_DN120214_c0_g1_i1:2712-4280(-)
MEPEQLQSAPSASRTQKQKAQSSEDNKFAQLLHDMEMAFDKKSPSSTVKAHYCKMFQKLLQNSSDPSQALSLLQLCGDLSKNAKKLPKKPATPSASKKSSPLKVPSSDITSTLAAVLQKKPCEKHDAETQDSFLVPPVHPPEYYINLPESVLLRLSPFNLQAHRSVVLSGLTPRVEFKCSLSASLKDVFRTLQSYFERVSECELAEVQHGQNLFVAVESCVRGSCLAWNSKSSSVTMKEVYLFAGKPEFLRMYYYWTVPDAEKSGQSKTTTEDVFNTDEYESLIQFLANIVSGVLQQMKKKRKKRPKPEEELSEVEKPQEIAQEPPEKKEESKKESSNSVSFRKIEEEIDMQQPFKKIFEKSRHSAKEKEDSRLFCDEFLSMTLPGKKQDPLEESKVENSIPSPYMQPMSAMNSLPYIGHQPPIFATNSNQVPLGDMESLQMMFSQPVPLPDPGYGSMLFASNQLFASMAGKENANEGESPQFPHPNDAFQVPQERLQLTVKEEAILENENSMKLSSKNKGR